ncbi:MAG TPA: HAD-IC family P-type ATPase, partial [Candidatus Babeliales bacterium]|nr:HAD-IC family P-type ATPase [Candidatus Babeliales bacterium]
MKALEYANKTGEQTAQELNTSIEHGLTVKQVALMRKEIGFNELKKKHLTWVHFLLKQLKSPFIFLLIGAAIISLFLHDLVNGYCILAIVIINTAIGFYQEFRAYKTVQFLQKYFLLYAHVLRSGKKITINSKELVPGDIIFITAGDMLPADIRIVHEENILINESILTGESIPSEKTSEKLFSPTNALFQAKNIGFMGTTISQGKAIGIVIATGKDASLGYIADIENTPTESNFNKSLRQFSTFVLISIIITFALLLILQLLIKGHNINLIELLMFSIALTIGITPEALPVVTTFGLSRGALQLAHKKVIVKRLSAIEDLGNIEILCTDKTGTLTENILTVDTIKPYQNSHVLFEALLANLEKVQEKHKNSDRDSFDQAIIAKLSKTDLEELVQHQSIKEFPFIAKKRKSAQIVKNIKNNLYEYIVRGAHEEIIPYSTNLNTQEKKDLHTWIQEQANQGNRILAIAKTPISQPRPIEPNNFTFLGLISFQDPIKKTVIDAIEKAAELNVKIKILTGDSPEIAGSIGYKIGLISNSQEVISGTNFDQLSLDEKAKIVLNNTIFARVSPEQKKEIISILQANNKQVGYLGDGINDAP